MQTTHDTPRYAGFWIRVAAAVIDGVVTYLVTIVLAFALGIALALNGGGEAMAELAGGLGGLLVGVLYFAGLESSVRQATLGKMAVGVLVTDTEGRRLTFARALGRYFAKAVSGLLLGVGFLMVAFTRRKQGLHDLMAGTLVVHRPRDT